MGQLIRILPSLNEKGYILISEFKTKTKGVKLLPMQTNLNDRLIFKKSTEINKPFNNMAYFFD